MTSLEASRVIGCHSSHVRWMIREGIIKKYTKRTLKSNEGTSFGFIYDIPDDEVERVKKLEVSGVGFPRGQSRSCPYCGKLMKGAYCQGCGHYADSGCKCSHCKKGIKNA